MYICELHPPRCPLFSHMAPNIGPISVIELDLFVTLTFPICCVYDYVFGVKNTHKSVWGEKRVSVH